MKKHWYDYLWIWTIIYFALGFFNILFAWLGMIDFQNSFVAIVLVLLINFGNICLDSHVASLLRMTLEARFPHLVGVFIFLSVRWLDHCELLESCERLVVVLIDSGTDTCALRCSH